MGGAIVGAESKLYALPHPATALVLFNGALIFAVFIFPVLHRLQRFLSRQDASLNKHVWMTFFSPVEAVIIGVLATIVFQTLRTR